jgi:hypothetical protein
MIIALVSAVISPMVVRLVHPLPGGAKTGFAATNSSIWARKMVDHRRVRLAAAARRRRF